MTSTSNVLVILFRILGVTALFALVAVFMPVSWMVATHRWLGLGGMPTVPVVEYLAPSLSAFFALLGALLLVAASDLERCQPLVRFLGVAFALMGLVLLGVDLAAEMPWWWSASERPGGVVFGALLFYLARPIHSKTGTPCPVRCARHAPGCERSLRLKDHDFSFVSCREVTRRTRSIHRSQLSDATATR
jgi:hypothetical protein